MRLRDCAILALVGTAFVAVGCGRGKKREASAPADAAPVDPAARVDQLFPAPEWRADDGTPRFVSAPEEKELILRVLARVEENRTRACPRPVVRGKASPGPSGPDVSALLRAEGTLGPCFEDWREREEELRAALRPADGGVEHASLAARRARSLDDPAGASGPMRRLAERCRALDSAIARATSHEDACSPFLVGKPVGDSPDRYLQVAWIAAVRVRALARSGAARRALELGIDTIRLGQDISRGGAGVIELVLAQLGVTVLWPHMVAVLRGENRLTGADLDALDGQIARLLDTQIHPSEALSSEPLEYLLYEVLPALEPREWEPPGGWRHYLRREETTGSRRRLIPPSESEKQGVLLSGLAQEALARDYVAACPGSASHKECGAGIDRVVEQVSTRKAELVSDPSSLLSREGLAYVLGENPAGAARYTREGLRELAMRLYQKAFADGDDPTYLQRAAFAEAALMALRVLLAARRLELAERRCVELADFDEAALRALLRRTTFGDALSVEKSPEGALRIVAPAWVDYKNEPPAPVPLVELPCSKPAPR